MKNPQLQELAVQTIKFFLILFAIHFFLDIGFRLFKIKFLDAHWIDSSLTISKIILWVLLAFIIAVYQVYFKK